MEGLPMSNTTKSQVNPNFQIPKRKNKAKIECKLVVLEFGICLVVLVGIRFWDFLWLMGGVKRWK